MPVYSILRNKEALQRNVIRQILNIGQKPFSGSCYGNCSQQGIIHTKMRISFSPGENQKVSVTPKFLLLLFFSLVLSHCQFGFLLKQYLLRRIIRVKSNLNKQTASRKNTVYGFSLRKSNIVYFILLSFHIVARALLIFQMARTKHN